MATFKNVQDILKYNDDERKKKLAQQTAPLNLATPVRISGDTETEAPGIAGILRKETKPVESIRDILGMTGIPHIVDQSDYNTYGKRVDDFTKKAGDTIDQAMPSTKQSVIDVQKQRDELSKEGTALLMYAGGNDLDQNKIRTERAPLMNVYDYALNKIITLNKYKSDLAYDIGENTEDYEAYARILDKYLNNPEDARQVLAAGQTKVTSGTQEIARRAAESAPTVQALEELLQSARTPEEQQIFTDELQRRRQAQTPGESRRQMMYDAMDDEMRAYVDEYDQSDLPLTDDELYDMLRGERDKLNLRYSADMTQEEKKALRLQIEKIDRALNGDAQAAGPEYQTPEMLAFSAWQEAGEDQPFSERYVQDAQQDAQDWQAATKGEYAGEDPELRKFSEDYAALEEEWAKAYYYNALGFDPETGVDYTPERQAELQQRADELQAQLEAMDAQAAERSGAANERANAGAEDYGEGSAERVVGSSVWKGFTGFADKFYQGIDFVLGRPVNAVGQLFDKDFENPYSKWARSYREGVYKPAETEANRAIMAMGGGKGWEIASQAISGIVENIPNTIIALMTGGASAAAGMAGMQSAAVEAMASQGASQAMQLAQSLLGDYNYWTSFMQEIGGDYQEAMDTLGEGANPITASIYAMVTGLINAGIEIGGEGTSGIQGIGQDTESGIMGQVIRAVTRRDMPLLESILDSATDEATEELKQGLVSGLAKKALLDHDLQWISTDGSDAVFNAQEIGESALVGGITGGALAGASAPVTGAIQDAQTRDIGEKVINNDFGKALAGIAEDVAGISNDTTKALREGKADLSKKSWKKTLGELYQDVMEKLDPQSYAALRRNIKDSIAGTLEEIGYRFNIAQDAETMTKAYTEGLGSLTQKQLERFKDTDFKKLFDDITGFGEFVEQYGQKALDKARDISTAMRSVAAMTEQSRAEITGENTDKAAEEAQALAQKAKVSPDAVMRVHGKEGEYTIRGVTVKDGKVMVKMKISADAETQTDAQTEAAPQSRDGVQEVAYDDIEFADQDTAERVAVAAALGEKEWASTLLNATVKTGKEFIAYAKDFAAAANAAGLGFNEKVIKNLGLAENLEAMELRAAAWAGAKVKLAADTAKSYAAQVMQAQKDYIRDQIKEHVDKAKLDEGKLPEVVDALYKLATGQKIKPTQKQFVYDFGIDQAFVDSLKENVQPADEAKAREYLYDYGIDQAFVDTLKGRGQEDGADLDPVETAREYGKAGLSQEELINNLKAAGIEMTSEAYQAYTKGETERIQAENDRVAEIQRLNQGGETKQRQGVVRSVQQADIDQLAAHGVRVNPVKSTMSENQRAVITAMRQFATRNGLNFVLFESPVDENGRRQGANG